MFQYITQYAITDKEIIIHFIISISTLTFPLESTFNYTHSGCQVLTLFHRVAFCCNQKYLNNASYLYLCITSIVYVTQRYSSELCLQAPLSGLLQSN